MKLQKLFLTALLVSALSPMTKAAIVEVNETNFPDPAFRNYLNSNFSSYITNGQINTDNIQDLGTISSDITDLTGIKNFKNLTTINLSNAAIKGLKFIDFRGLSKLYNITFTSGAANAGGASTNTACSTTTNNAARSTWNNNCVIEVMLLDETAIKNLYIPSFECLNHLSLKNCASLQTINIKCCSNIQGLDLTGCTDLRVIYGHYTRHTSWLNLDDNAKSFHTLHMGYNNLTRLILPRNGWERPVGITNFSGPNIQESQISELHYGAVTATSGAIIRKIGLPHIPNGNVSGTVLTAGTTASLAHTYRAGVVDEFMVHDQTDSRFKSASTASVTGGTVSNGIFKFTNSTTKTAKYTYTCYNSSTSAASFVVNVERILESERPKYYIEYSLYNPIRDEYYTQKEEKSVALSTSNYDRIELVPSENEPNTYEYTGHIFGNFRIIEVSKDGSEKYLGANSSQITSVRLEKSESGANSFVQGYVQLNSENGAAYDYAIHLTQPAATFSQGFDSGNANRTVRASEPMEFTTHVDESLGFADGGRQISKGTLKLHYIQGNPAGTMNLISGTTTGVDGIQMDNVSAEDGVDENAPVEFYDLQGRKVQNPSKGLYIKRQGNIATKVLL